MFLFVVYKYNSIWYKLEKDTFSEKRSEKIIFSDLLLLNAMCALCEKKKTKINTVNTE